MIPRFRIWHKEYNKMYDVCEMRFKGHPDMLVLRLDKGSEPCEIEEVWPDEIELMQWTEFKTNTGQDIYESDIVSSYIRPEIIYVVKQIAGEWRLDPIDDYYNAEAMISNDHMSFAIIKGNIYQNGELLNVSNPS